MKPLFIVAFALTLGACAAKPAGECRSLQCELDLAAADIARACSTDLFLYPKGKRSFIDREYSYPFTNYDTYSTLLKLGSRVPSPQEWCAGYAAFKMQVRMPTSSG